MSRSCFNGIFNETVVQHRRAQAGESADTHHPWQLQDDAAARNPASVRVQAVNSGCTSTVFIGVTLSTVSVHVCGNMPDGTFEIVSTDVHMRVQLGDLWAFVLRHILFAIHKISLSRSVWNGFFSACRIRHTSPNLKQSRRHQKFSYSVPSDEMFDPGCFTDVLDCEFYCLMDTAFLSM